MPILFILFVVVPIAELYVLIQVGQEIGALTTIALVIAVSVVGAWLAKREGLGVWRRMRAQMAAGQVPAANLVDGVLILFGGALLLTPGFITDVLGLVLLLPPTRAAVRGMLRRSLVGRVETLRSVGRYR